MRKLEAFAWLLITITFLTGAKIKTANLTLWTPEKPLGNSGGFHISFVPKGFTAGTTPQKVSVDLYDDENRRVLTAAHTVGKNQKTVDEIWRLKPGLYRLVRIRYNGRTWLKWKNSKLVLIRSGELSNLGRVVIKPHDDKGISVSWRRVQLPFKYGSKENNPFHAVIDGFAGKTQTVRKGHHAGKLSKAGPGGTYVASFSYYGKVQLSYNISVNRQNHAKPLLARIDSDRSLFQQCYTEQVQGDKSGKVRFKFTLDTKTNRLDRLKMVHSDIGHSALENCLNNQLGMIDYSGSKDLTGTITFNFNVGQHTL